MLEKNEETYLGFSFGKNYGTSSSCQSSPAFFKKTINAALGALNKAEKKSVEDFLNTGKSTLTASAINALSSLHLDLSEEKLKSILSKYFLLDSRITNKLIKLRLDSLRVSHSHTL